MTKKKDTATAKPKKKVKFKLERKTIEELKSEELDDVAGGVCTSASCCLSGCKTKGDPGICPDGGARSM